MLTNDQVVDSFEQGFDCAQVVLEHYADRFSIDIKELRKISTGFGAGCMRGETCGALIGAYMVLGLLNGVCECGEAGQIQKVQSLKVSANFNEEFFKKFGAYTCKELLGADISTKEGAEKIMSENLMNAFCPNLVVEVTRILDSLV